MVAGLFYLGSSAGLTVGDLVGHLCRTAGDRQNESRIHIAEVPWLLGAIVAGGVAGPALLMLGLSSTPAATSSLLLNLEGVLTAVIAWAVCRHPTSTDRGAAHAVLSGECVRKETARTRDGARSTGLASA
jgi:drug/metabolite transporter (DMT)-like permease